MVDAAQHVPTAAERISDRFLAAMAVGVLQPGQRLPAERELAGLLGVSRTTVRHALGRLAALGVVDSRLGRRGGTFVTSPAAPAGSAGAVRRTLEPIRTELEALFDYRSLVEQLIARTAAARRSGADMARMRELLVEYGAASGAARSRAADRALHAAIAAAAGNPHLAKLSTDLVSRVNLGFPTDPWSEDLHRKALAQHRSLVEAVIAGDADRAAEVAGQHFHLTTTSAWRSALDRASMQAGGDAGHRAATGAADGAGPPPGGHGGVAVAR